MKKKAKKKVRIGAGIIALLYFFSPLIFEIKKIKLEGTSWYDWFFVPEYVYNYFKTISPNGQLIPFIGLFVAGSVFWVCLYYLTMAIYDVYLDIYLNKRRFEKDVEGN